jgi:hypothetical protein
LIDDDNFFVGAEGDFTKNAGQTLQKKIWSYMKISVMFSDFQFTTSYQISQVLETVKCFGFDQSQTVLILLTLKYGKKKRQYSVKLIDLDDDSNESNTLYHGKVTNTTLIGRLISTLYSFVDGHIYYNNDVIKIRYDLLRGGKNVNDLDECEVFDFYQNILQLKGKEFIRFGTPLAQHVSHRLIYVT